jgi:ABC-type bacteriocin/lantibiotic exporter with double-glycine peptidase domain
LTTILLLIALISADPGSYEIQGVPFVKQESLFCGPASIESVFAYYGLAIDQGTIAKEVYTEKLQGALITDMQNYARAQGFQTRLDQGTMDTLKTLVKTGRPVLVLVDLGFWVFSKPHYLVVTGYNDRGFIVHTGYKASQLFEYEEFETIWKKKGCVYLSIWR